MTLIEYIEKSFLLQSDQNEFFRPSSFWREAANNIFHEIRDFGIENFRSLPLPLGYFVPTYGSPANSLNIDIETRIRKLIKDENCSNKQELTIMNFLTGYNHAFSDYRVLKAADNTAIKPTLHLFSESSYGNPKEQFEIEGKYFSRSSLNYLLGLAFLKKHIGNDEIRTVLEIGGGFGTLGEILKYSSIPMQKYINFDIPPISFISWNYLSNIYPKQDINSLDSMMQKGEINIDGLEACSIFNNWQIESLNGEVDLFVNFISFQEMEPHLVANYLKHIIRLNTKWVLLRNIREGKQVKSKENTVGVEVPILKEDYLNMLRDTYELVDSNVIPYGFRTVDNFNSELMLFKRRS